MAQNNQVVVELQVDAGNAAAGARQFEDSMKKAETSATKAANSVNKAQESISKSTENLGGSARRAASSWARTAGGADAVTKATNDLARAQASANSALNRGLATQEQVNSVLGVYRARLDAATAVANKSASAVKLNAGQVQNLTYQMNDLAVMTASGQNPFIMLMQQGMQITQIFGPGVGVLGALKAVGSALVGFVSSPLTLMVVGLAAAAGAATLLWDTVVGGGESAEDVLKRQKALIEDIKDAYDDSTSAAERLGMAQGQMWFTEAAKENLALTKEMAAATEHLSGQMTALVSNSSGIGKFIFGGGGMSAPNQGMLEDTQAFLVELQNGTADVIKFRDHLDDIGRAFPTAENKEYIDVLKHFTDPLFEAETHSRELQAAIALMSGTASDAQKELLGLGTAADEMGKSFAKAMEKLADVGLPELTEKMRALQSFDEAMKNASGMEERLLVMREYEKSLDRIGDREREETAKKANEDAAAAAKKYAEAVKGVGTNLEFEIEQTKRSAREQAIWSALKQAGAKLYSLEGIAIAAAAGKLYDMEAAQKASTEAAKNAASDSKKRADAIDNVTTSLQFEIDQLGRSAREQAIFTALQKAGVEASSAQGASIASMAGHLFDLEAAQKASTEATKDAAKEAEKLVEARKKLAEDIAFERGLISLSEDEVAIATKLRSVYGEDIPTALSSWEAGQLRVNAALKKAQELGEAIKDSLAKSLEEVFTGGVKSVGEFVDSLTKGIAQASAKMLSERLTDKLFGGALAPVDTAGMKTATALTTAASSVVAATPPLAAAASSLATAASSLKSAATSTTKMAAGGWSVGATNKAYGAASGAMSPITTASGLSAQVASAYAPAFQGFLNDLIATGYKITSLGGYNNRNIAGTSTPSYHSVGAAIDINPSSNPVTYGKAITDLPSNIAELARKWGLGWGGNWSSKKDPMHFSAAMGEGGTYNVNRYGGVGSIGTVNTNQAGLSSPLVPKTGASVSPTNAVPVSVVAAPAPAFSGLNKIVSSPMFQQAISGFSMGVQSQSPVMGGLSGALSGLMAGGPVGAVVGGVSGVLGGIFGKRRAEQEALERAQEAWKAMADEVKAFSEELRGKVRGDLGDALLSAEQRFKHYQKAAKDAGESTAGLARDLEKFRHDQKADFERMFGANMKAFRSGLGDDDPFLKAAQSMAGLREELMGFVSDVKLVGGKRKVNNAREAAQGFVLGQIGGTNAEELTAYEEEVRRINGTRKQAIALLQDLGMGEKKARQAVNDQIELALAEAKRIQQEAIKDRKLGYQDRLYSASNDPALLATQLALFDRQAQREREDEQKAGGEAMIELEAALAAERLKIQKDFNDDAVEAAKRAAEEVNRIARNIADYVNSLNTSEDYLSPVDKFNASKTTFQSQYALAQGGNTDAQSSITQYADDYIKAAREMYASSSDFFSIMNDVKTKLLALPAVQAATDPVVVALVNAQNAITSSVNSTTTAVTASTAAITAMRNAVTSAINAGPAATAAALGPYFSAIDTNGSGGITFAEMQTALTGLATNAQITALMNAMDTNSDGQIDQLEFINSATGGTNTGVATLKTSLATVNTSLGTLDTSVRALKGSIDSATNGLPAINTSLGPSDTSGIKRWTKESALNAKDVTKGTNWLPVMAQRLYEVALFTSKAKGVDGDIKSGPDKSGYTRNNTFKDWSIQNTYNVTASHGGVVGSFAPGGVVGNGMWNIDSVRARYARGGDIMLAGGEGIINAQAMKMIGPRAFEMLQKGGVPNSDDNGKYFAEQNRIMAAIGRATVSTLEKILDRLDSIDGSNEVIASKSNRTIQIKQAPLRG